MPSRRSSKKDSPAKLAGRIKRRWRVVLLRAKGEILGTVGGAHFTNVRFGPASVVGGGSVAAFSRLSCANCCGVA